MQGSSPGPNLSVCRACVEAGLRSALEAAERKFTLSVVCKWVSFNYCTKMNECVCVIGCVCVCVVCMSR